VILKDQRAALVRAVRREVETVFGAETLRSRCLQWAVYAARALAARGERACVQAGSAAWPCLAVDDGVSPTHFAYVWDPDSAETSQRTALGLMPEMHAWVALPDSAEIVDLSAGYQLEQAKLRGVRWTAPPPPEYVWSTAAELPAGVRYSPCVRAIMWCLQQYEKSGEYSAAEIVSWGL
jgi:hypothetical protein